MFSFYRSLFVTFRATFLYSGRSQRKEFWLFLTVYVLLYFAAIGADVTYYRQAEPSGLLIVLMDLFGGHEPFLPLFFILFTPPLVSLTVRRLHDRGFHGWWSLLGLLPILGWLPLAFLVGRKGQEGFNRFGADPLAMAQVMQAKTEAQSEQSYGEATGSSYAPAE
nr:DUF805 domain-containing protein [uncultured Cohaesibacter sp.]